MHHRFVVASLLFALSFPLALAAAENWPQWRGPSRDGHVAGATWPESLQKDRLTKTWSVPLAESYAGPVVSGDLVYTVETKDREVEIVRALDRRTGEQRWQQEWKGAIDVPFFAAKNGSWVRSTPACDGERLYVAGMKDVLVCLDAKTGKPIWRVDFMKRFDTPVPAFGFVCSPLVTDDAVYVQAGASFVKLNKKTGETIWRTLNDDGGMFGSAFSSPVIATIQGRSQLLVQTRTKLAGVDAKDGSVLWEQTIEAFRGMNILTPTVFDNTVFTSSYGGRSLQLKIDQEGGKFTASQAWDNRLQGYMTSPVIVGDHAYLLLRSNRFACIALGTGEIKWVTEESLGEYWSIVAQGDRLLALDEKGTLFHIKANPAKFELLDRRRVTDQETWAHLTVVGDEIFIRELKAMTAYRWK